MGLHIITFDKGKTKSTYRGSFTLLNLGSHEEEKFVFMRGSPVGSRHWSNSKITQLVAITFNQLSLKHVNQLFSDRSVNLISLNK